ncbi:MAG TPA: formate dehydrogenase accessory protein FdhE [Thermoanaerobaculia bacterium]|nr:formate dehydrogenase accessory protein FdhE [Thermoanaerobaculia bacterium]
MNRTTLDAWLAAHPYLRPLAHWTSRVEGALASIPASSAPVPDWNDGADDLRAGVPLLRSGLEIDLEPAGRAAVALVEKLSLDPTHGGPMAHLPLLAEHLRGDPEAPRRVGDWLLGDEAFAPPSPGLLRYLGWTAASRYLAPLVTAFDAWRDEEKWLRPYCPACGSAPAMAQLLGVDPGRKRLLACGACGSRWQFRRTACPFCESDSQRLASVVVEGEAGLRIDSCDACGGYLKTYDGHGDETLLMSDWTSLHLDLVARDRGLKGLAASLYDVGSVAGQPLTTKDLERTG